MDESAGSADREMGIIQESLSFKINALKETWTGFLQGLIDKNALGGLLDFVLAISNAVTSLIGVFGELDSVLSALISLSISRFTGKNFFNFDRETGKILFQNPFKKESEIESSDEVSLGSKKLEGTKVAAEDVEATIDALNAKEITLGSNSVAIENLEQVEAKVQEVAATLDEATVAFQEAQIAIYGEQQKTNTSTVPVVDKPELDEVGQQWDDYLARNEPEVVVTPVIDEPALKEVSDDISDVASGKKTFVSSKKKNRSAKRQKRKARLQTQNEELTPEAEQWQALATAEDTAAVEANTAANMENAASQEAVATSSQEKASGLETSSVAAEADTVATEQDTVANIENATSQTAVGAAAQEATAGLEAATIAADEEAAAMERMAVSTQTGGSALSQLSSIGVKGTIGNAIGGIADGLTNFAGVIGTVGKSIASIAGNFLIVLAVIKGIQLITGLINDRIHYNENAIKAGKEAVESINKTYDEYNNKVESIKSVSSKLSDDESVIKSTSDSIENLGQKYTELSRGVDTLSNRNLSLNNEDYQSFLDTSNQIAGVLPSLVQGYDSNGNAILNIGNNAVEASAKLKETLELQQQLAHYDMTGQIDTQIKSIFAQNDEYKKKHYDREIAEIKESIEHNENTPLDQLMFDSEDERKEYIDGLYKELKYYKGQQKVLTQQIEENWKSIIPSVQDLLKTDTGFTNLNEELQDKIIGSIGSLNSKHIQDILTKHGDSEIEFEAYLRSTYIEPFEKVEKAGLTDRLLQLFDMDKSEQTIEDYTSKINKELNTIFKDDKSQIPVWENILGINDLKEQQELVHNILDDTTDKLEVTVDQFDSLTMGDRDIAYDLIVNDKFEGTFDELKAKIAETKKDLENTLSLDATPLLDKYNEALEKAKEEGTQGKNYDEYGAALKQLKEDYDKGLIGTDTFKKGAKMFSVGGATDADNFIKNYERISKFWNEENPVEGVKAFADEMTRLNLMEKSDDGEYVTKFDDIREAAQEAQMPLELFYSMFKKLEEFGWSNDFFVTKEEGFQTIGELTGDLAAAKAELEKLNSVKPENRNKSAIKAKEDEIKSLQKRLKDAQKQLLDFLNGGGLKEYTENYENQQTAAQKALYKLNHSKNFKNATEEQKNIMLEAVRSGFENSGLDPNVYKNMGFNKNGAMVLDVESSNKKVDEVLEAAFGNGKLSKETSEYYGGKTPEQLVDEWAKNLGLSTEDYRKKMEEFEDKPIVQPEEVPKETSEEDKNVGAMQANTTSLNSLKSSVDTLNATMGGNNPEDSTTTETGTTPEGTEPPVTKASQEHRTPKSPTEDQGILGKLTGGVESVFNIGTLQVSAAEVPKDGVDGTSRTPNKDFNFTTRKRVSGSDMQYNGWDADKNDYATVNTVGYTDENGKEYVVTPILPNGEVLDPEGLDEYVGKVMDGAPDEDNLVISTFEGEGARKAADDYAQALHEVHEAYYNTDKSARAAVESLKNYSAEELHSIDLTDNSTSEMENQFTSLMESMNLSSDQAEQFINVLQDMGLLKITPQVDLSGVQTTEELNDKLSGNLEVGQSVTYKANVEGVEEEVKAVEEQEGTITYYAKDLEGVEKEVEPVAKKDGTITYHFKTEDDDKTKDKTGDKDGGTVTTKVDADTSKFDEKTNQVKNKVQDVSGQKATPSVGLHGASQVLSSLSSILSRIRSLDGKNAKVTLTTVKETIIKKTTTSFNGTFHSSGTFHIVNAYGKGTTSSNNVSVQKDETALINELGKEIVVRDGKAMTFNNGYPVYANLKKGDIVFNHKSKFCGLAQRCA